MPWKEETVENLRRAFVVEAIREGSNISELCRRYGITRKTGYKWIQRYYDGMTMLDQSRAPILRPHKTPPETEELIIAVRCDHPSWGARKILRYLANKGNHDLPVPSTATAILKRNGFITPEQSALHTPFSRFSMMYPNDMWQMDFKGHFAMQNGQRCHPLTIKDDCSRALLCLDAYDNERWGSVKTSLLRVFSEYGLPRTILCDNGSPWGDSKNGYTPFELWMMQMDVLPIHGRPFHPQTQGKEERFHRTLNEDVLKRTTLRDLNHAQVVFDAYRWEFNYERPHDALGLDVPAKHYNPSSRKMPDNFDDPEYDAGKTLRKVNYKGYISIQNHRYYLSETFIGKYLELIPCGEDQIEICYGNFVIAKIDLNERLFISRKIFRK